MLADEAEANRPLGLVVATQSATWQSTAHMAAIAPALFHGCSTGTVAQGAGSKIGRLAR